MEDLIGEIYFSKRQNVSLKNSLVMHKGLLSLWRSIFKEKCWDNFYILITEKDLIKTVLDIKIAWGGGWARIIQWSRGEVKENVWIWPAFWSCFDQARYAFLWSPLWSEATFTGTLMQQGNMVEKRVQRRACCVQLRFPVIPPSWDLNLFLLSWVPKINPELRMGLFPGW